MTDLTKITTAFGLLDAETQEALRAHGGPYEQYTGFMWEERAEPAWWHVGVYRVQPQPPKPREWWLRLDARGAVIGSDTVDGPPPPKWEADRTILVREVDLVRHIPGDE